MAATERLKGACARYAEEERRAFRSASAGWFRGKGIDWEKRFVQPAFTRLWRATMEDWTRIAASLLRRWKLPEHRGGVDDMLQEVAIGLLKALRKFVGARGTELSRYLVWTARAYAELSLRKLRGAKLSGNPSRNPSRIERPFSSLGSEDSSGSEDAVESAMFASGMLGEPVQANRLEAEERREEVLDICESWVEEIVVEVTFGGLGFDEGARRLYGDPESCLAYRIGCQAGARRVIGSAALALVERCEEELVA